MAEWCRARNDPEAAQFDKLAERILKTMNEALWNESAGWFDNLYPDGSHHLVWTYHLFDLLDTDVLTGTPGGISPRRFTPMCTATWRARGLTLQENHNWSDTPPNSPASR